MKIYFALLPIALNKNRIQIRLGIWGALAFILILSNGLSAQTMGIFQNDSLSFNGYTLFSPTTYNKTYLIDNCGNVVNEWTSDYDPGMMAYLLPNGDLLRTARIGSSFSSGGTGGRLEIFDWEGNLIWSYNYSSDDYHQHHSVRPLSNGNILVLAWERKTQTEAILAGRNPDNVGAQGLWSEKVVEIEPIGTNEINIVWEWHLWDHLIQDYDNSLPNAGVISDHPELMDLNFGSEFGTDWIHANSIDYNSELDQIVISSRNFNEFWIIDHSTTTQEAASHSGGDIGKGGDILYRWGNPQTYQRGTSSDKKLFGQHDVHWINPGLMEEGKIVIFNNGGGRSDGNYSSIDVINPPITSGGDYLIEGGQSFDPQNLDWTYTSIPKTDFFAARVSGAQRLPNGNTLICNGRIGEFFEIQNDGTQVWNYKNPVGNNGPFSQGNNPTTNDVFKVLRYAPDFSGFIGKNLEAGDPIELDPLPNDCVLFSDPISSISSAKKLEGVILKNNPVYEDLFIDNLLAKNIEIEIVDVMGNSIFIEKFNQKEIQINTGNWLPGMYFIRIFNQKSPILYTQKLIKH